MLPAPHPGPGDPDNGAEDDEQIRECRRGPGEARQALRHGVEKCIRPGAACLTSLDGVAALAYTYTAQTAHQCPACGTSFPPAEAHHESGVGSRCATRRTHGCR